MQILDWRSRGEKFLTSCWSAQTAQTGRSDGIGNRLWARLHDRVIAYRVAQRPPANGQPLLISVGNLSLGGTGKTPVVIALARDLAELGHRGVVLTRGFRSPLAGPLDVKADNVLAGDEARLLAASLQDVQWSVVQSRRRSRGLDHILARDVVLDIVLVEDGHQTAGVGRDMDILILDHWSVVDTEEGPCVDALTGPVFPFGPWRESATGAQRAHIWLLETGDQVPARTVWGGRVVTFQREFACRGVNAAASAAANPEHPALVSGIARPARFEAGAENLLSAQPRLAVRLADHAPYGPRLLGRVKEAMKESGCRSLVTTAKDWIKIEPYWPDALPAYVIDLAITWGNGETLTELVGERLKRVVGEEEAP